MADVSHLPETSTADVDAVPPPRQGGKPTANDTRRTGHGSGKRRTAKRDRSEHHKRRVLKIAAITSAAVVVIVASVGVLLYERLNNNLTSVPISGAGTEKPDAFGRTPINILVIGSDGRSKAADCKLGGDCGAGQNADVEMLLHLSADRSNATAVSIPRDTVTHIPPCRDSQNNTSESGYMGVINSALQYGPACQVQAVHQLTGIPIDHFTMIDFSGVVNMSDAVGGVQVCVNNNVYDTDSHLKLSRGSHTLQGVAALEWLRSRHAFGFASDLERTRSQHMYLSALMRKLKSAGTLTDPTALYRLADAATKALTVDSHLNSISKLIGLANDINKVPTNRITFTTMQTVQDPDDKARVLVGPGAESLFGAIINDQSLTAGSGGTSRATTRPGPATASSASPTQQAVSTSQIAVQVENASGVNGRASAIAQSLISQGFNPNTGAANASAPASSTTIHYAPGRQAEARTVAHALGIPDNRLEQYGNASGVTLVIGADWSSGITFATGGNASPAPADTHKALINANAQTANDSTTCAQASTYPTLKVNGTWISPIRAYALFPNVPNSAP